ncbi:MAG: hypothetical protein JO269_01825 [Burkholderiaceae bacterium]|nr:hypothetical protein [Burkholderiaceae bacterium]
MSTTLDAVRESGSGRAGLIPAITSTAQIMLCGNEFGGKSTDIASFICPGKTTYTQIPFVQSNIKKFCIRFLVSGNNF